VKYVRETPFQKNSRFPQTQDFAFATGEGSFVTFALLGYV
jgi:hypothetical protein